MTTENRTVEQPQTKVQTDQAIVLETFLIKAVRPPSGLTLQIATFDQPRKIFDGLISKVKVTNSWIAFSINGVDFRTASKTDRDNFFAWYTSEQPAPFSKKKGEEKVFGPPDVTFTKVCHVCGK